MQKFHRPFGGGEGQRCVACKISLAAKYLGEFGLDASQVLVAWFDWEEVLGFDD